MGNGFNLGHCAFGPIAAEAVQQFAAVVPGHHRRFLGPAPEQAFLCYALAFTGVRFSLLQHLDPEIAGFNGAEYRAQQDASGAYCYTEGPWAGRRLISMKRNAAPGAVNRNMHIFADFRQNT